MHKDIFDMFVGGIKSHLKYVVEYTQNCHENVQYLMYV
jgi:hypothetical protein